MSSGYLLPALWSQAKPLLEQSLQQIQAANPVGQVQKPYPPQDLIVQPGSLQVVLSWIPPSLGANLSGYRVYKGDENHLFQVITDPGTTQCTIPLAANTPVGLYVSCFNEAGESQKVFIRGTSNTDQHVVTGTSGGTGGTVPVGYPPPPNRHACFSGDVKLITSRGLVRFDELRIEDKVLTSKRTWRPLKAIHVHENWQGMAYHWPGGGYVTQEEVLLFDGKWRCAIDCRLGPAFWHEGTVFHVTVDCDEEESLRFSLDTERSITLANGWVAHNIKPYYT
jgi:hypothetical protein